MQTLLRSPRGTLLGNLRGERPNPQQHYKVGIYIRYFNQTKHADYLDYHVKQYQDIACHFCVLLHFVIVCDKLFYEFVECLAGSFLLLPHTRVEGCVDLCALCGAKW